MQRIIYSLLVVFSFFGSTQTLAQRNYTALVNPMVGTGGHGHTFPGPVLPFGMVQAGPDTRIDGSWDGCSGYHYSDSIIYGFSHTHLSGTGCSDYGDVMLMPVIDNPNLPLEKVLSTDYYHSKFNHSNEIASPGYYSVLLNKFKIKAELTTTLRTAMHRYSYGLTGTPGIVIDLNHRDKLIEGSLKKIDDYTLEGKRVSNAWAIGQVVYFRIKFNRKIKQCKLLSDSTLNSQTVSGVKQVKGLILFEQSKDPLEVNVAISGVDEKGAENNLRTEALGLSFETMTNLANATWNKELAKIEVKGGREKDQKNFYTALYHCFIHPSTYQDADGRYRGRDNKIYQLKQDATGYYTVFSLWDTFRALHPLFNLVQRQRNQDFIYTFLEQAKQSGRMPMWELSGYETNCMIGYHSVSVLADAYAKGLRNFDTKEAWQACKNTVANHELGLDEFRKQYYLNIEDEHESVSKHLEYAYNHWALNQFAQMSGNIGDQWHGSFSSGKQWQLLFNPANGFMQARYNGGWFAPFKPEEVNNYYTEANAWQYSTFAPQDVEGLIKAHGGNDKFEKHLDALFSASTKTSGRQQADITGLIGQYAHGNEPSHHVIYLYNYCNSPEKTRALANKVMREFYTPEADGLIGNEDCGQMSAWYVFSALGFYPVTPGIAEYQMGYPLFEEVTIHAEDYRNGKWVNEVVTIEYKKEKALDFGYTYKINGKEFGANTTLAHRSLFPNHTVGNTNYIEKETFYAVPVIESASKVFTDSILVNIYIPQRSTIEGDMEVFIYNPDGTILNKLKYTNPFYIKQSCNVVAQTKAPNGLLLSSKAEFKQNLNKYDIQLNCTYNPQYTAGGKQGLLDGIRGDIEWRKGGWQGYQGQDFEAIINFKSTREIKEISSHFLQDQRSWIFLPSEVMYEYSIDGKTYKPLANFKKVSENEYEQLKIENFITKLNEPIKASFIKVKAINYGKLPSWHPGAGEPSFIFIDEIEIK